ncbi:MAG: delta-60 repeat domain-containing protein [Candidatus Promineifilaceae bacterium]
MITNSNPETAENIDGQLDPNFGSGGIVTTDFGTNSDTGNAVAVQPDGKIILAGSLFNGSNGDIGLARYLNDGTLDTTFGNNGKIITDLNGRHDQANAIALQPDGRIIVAGASYLQPSNDQDFVVLRYYPNGALDPTFSGNGWVFTDMGTNFDSIFDMVIQPDGKIVVAGVAELNGQGDFAVARYLPDGTLDTSFDSDGKVTTDLGSTFDWAFGVALQNDGKIVAAGEYFNGSDFDFALIRYEADGSLDTTFDGDGIVITDINQVQNEVRDVLIQENGKIVVSGFSHITAQNDGIFTLAQYNQDGSLDAAFGSGGIALSPIGGADVSNGLARQPDGKILMVGDTWNGTDIDVAITRFLPNGDPDPDFGSGGVVTTDIDQTHNGANAVVVQPDGNIVVAGYVFFEDNGDMSLIRYLSKPILGENTSFIPSLLKD